MNGLADPWHDASRAGIGSNAAVASDVVDRLLVDRVHPDDLPVGYREMARAFRALKSPASEDELSRESIAVQLSDEVAPSSTVAVEGDT